MPYNAQLGQYYSEEEAHYFEYTVVKLIDGFIGQVNFGGEIIHQTQLVAREGDNDPTQEAAKLARQECVAAMKKLFQ